MCLSNKTTIIERKEYGLKYFQFSFKAKVMNWLIWGLFMILNVKSHMAQKEPFILVTQARSGSFLMVEMLNRSELGMYCGGQSENKKERIFF